MFRLFIAARSCTIPASCSGPWDKHVPRCSAEPATAADSAAAAEDEDIPGWSWAGWDEFTPLGDRVDAPPLPLPTVARGKRVVLVRHGQSTWNARNRIQGSSNFSVLTEKGEGQAQAAQQLVCVCACLASQGALCGALRSEEQGRSLLLHR